MNIDTLAILLTLMMSHHFWMIMYTLFFISMKLISILKLRCLKNKHTLSTFSSLGIFSIVSISSEIKCKEQYHTNKQNGKKHQKGKLVNIRNRKKNVYTQVKGQETVFVQEVIFQLNDVQRNETRARNICGTSTAKQIQVISNVSGKMVS